MAGDASPQAPGLVSVDQLGGVLSQFGGQLGAVAGVDVGLAHPDHGRQVRLCRPQVRGCFVG
ncbi:Uncharacterised protein [Mycobacteroides abscessus subsp. massiliense]|nr:Uncharacterised protein [Mycobacteroides abscessus subsp. massiliense]